jgi:C4-dicarboxylate transporter, DctQ subunit
MSEENPQVVLPVFKKIGRAASLTAGAALAIVMLLTVSSVLLRAIRINVPDALDFSSLFMGVAIFWGIASTFLDDSNVRVEFVGASLGENARRAVLAVANSIAFLFIAFMAYASWGNLQTALHGGEVTPQLRIPLWPFICLAWLGLCVSAIVAFSMLMPRSKRIDNTDAAISDGMKNSFAE